MEKISVGAYIFDFKNHKILTVLDTNGRIGIPKGSLNVGESPWEGAMREIWEETGLALEITQKTANIKYDFTYHKSIKHGHDNMTVTRIFYIIYLDSFDPKLNNLCPKDINEIQGATWRSYLELVKNKEQCNTTITGKGGCINQFVTLGLTLNINITREMYMKIFDVKTQLEKVFVSYGNCIEYDKAVRLFKTIPLTKYVDHGWNNIEGEFQVLVKLLGLDL